MPPDHDSLSSTKAAPGDPVKEDNVVYKLPLKAEQEAIRRSQWKGALEQELQASVQEASGIRKNINEAKTPYKKKYYEKKFKKMQSKVMQMVAALQRIQAQEAPPPQPTLPEQKEEQHAEATDSIPAS